MLPYQGVKFIPKLSHKYGAGEPFNLEERNKQLAAKKERETKKLQEIEVNQVTTESALNAFNESKMKKTQQIITTTKTINRSLLNSSLNNNNNNNNNNKYIVCNKENLISTLTYHCQQDSYNINADSINSNNNNNNNQDDANEHKQNNMISINTTSIGNDSILSNKGGGGVNTSTMSNSSRKRVDLKPVLLHTEARAQKRHQYDQYLKDKERMAELIKKNLEMQKLVESKQETLKYRSQLVFKSKPFKQIKPMEVRPSNKPLTEPKSPQLGMHLSTSKLTNSITNKMIRSLSQDNLSTINS